MMCRITSGTPKNPEQRVRHEGDHARDGEAPQPPAPARRCARRPPGPVRSAFDLLIGSGHASLSLREVYDAPPGLGGFPLTDRRLSAARDEVNIRR